MSKRILKRDASFVTIGIHRETFAVPVEVVLEILDMQPIFRIPEAPAYLRGLIDVRGRSVAVVDMRIRLGLDSIEADQNTRIVVLDLEIGDRRLALGLIADRVFEVISIDTSSLEPAPEIGSRWNSAYIRGIGRRNDAFFLVLDLDGLFGQEASRLPELQRAHPVAA